jgi:hypothetical protein
MREALPPDPLSKKEGEPDAIGFVFFDVSSKLLE